MNQSRALAFAVCVSLCTNPSATLSEPSRSVLYRSTSFGNFFVGFFVPLPEPNSENFETCDGRRLFVSREEVTPIVEEECGRLRSMYTNVSDDVLRGTPGLRFSSISTGGVGEFQSAFVSDLGEVVGYAVQFPDEFGWQVFPAEEVIVWSIDGEIVLQGANARFTMMPYPDPGGVIPFAAGGEVSEALGVEGPIYDLPAFILGFGEVEIGVEVFSISPDESLE